MPQFSDMVCQADAENDGIIIIDALTIHPGSRFSYRVHLAVDGPVSAVLCMLPDGNMARFRPQNIEGAIRLCITDSLCQGTVFFRKDIQVR